MSSDRCLNCNERIEYFTDRADGVDRWLHVISGTPRTVYQECRPPRTVAEPSSAGVVGNQEEQG